MKILIANRGEIALRIARTAQRLGHEVVGVTTDVDSASQHAISLNAITVPSYLDGAAIISAARESGCGAIHPGYAPGPLKTLLQRIGDPRPPRARSTPRPR